MHCKCLLGIFIPVTQFEKEKLTKEWQSQKIMYAFTFQEREVAE